MNHNKWKRIYNKGVEGSRDRIRWSSHWGFSACLGNHGRGRPWIIATLCGTGGSGSGIGKSPWESGEWVTVI